MSRQEGLHRVTRISLGTACRLGCAASQLAEPEDDLPALLEKLLAEGVVGTVEVSSAAWITARRFSATPSLREMATAVVALECNQLRVCGIADDDGSSQGHASSWPSEASGASG